MKDILLYAKDEKGLSKQELQNAVDSCIEQLGVSAKTLLIPPDYTRMHSGAGILTQLLYNRLYETSHVDIMPALGTHFPVSDEERVAFFGDIPAERFLEHNWKTGVVGLGEVPAEYVHEVSDGVVD